MRKNLILLLLVCCSLIARRSPQHQWEDSWREEQFFCAYQSNRLQSLMVDRDQYAYFESAPGPWKVVEQGLVEASPEGGFRFLPRSGEPKTGQLTEKKLISSWGVLELEDCSVPRLKPVQTWLAKGRPFSIQGIRLGMTRSEVKNLYPDEATTAGGNPSVFFYGDFSHCVEVLYSPTNRVVWVAGDRLEQARLPLFNERSRRTDVERVFPDQQWVDHESTMRVPQASLEVCGRKGPLKEFAPGFRFILGNLP